MTWKPGLPPEPGIVDLRVFGEEHRNVRYLGAGECVPFAGSDPIMAACFQWGEDKRFFIDQRGYHGVEWRPIPVPECVE